MRKGDRESRRRQRQDYAQQAIDEDCAPFKYADDQRGLQVDKQQSSQNLQAQKNLSKSQRQKDGDPNLLGDLRLGKSNDIKKIQELRTTELDASKSELRASINSLNLDLSLNYPEFKKKISRDTSIERIDKSKALFGQIGNLQNMSHKRIMEVSSKSPSFLTDQNFENKSLSFINSSTIDIKQLQQMEKKIDRKMKSKQSRDKPNQQHADTQQINSLDFQNTSEIKKSQRGFTPVSSNQPLQDRIIITDNRSELTQDLKKNKQKLPYSGNLEKTTSELYNQESLDEVNQVFDIVKDNKEDDLLLNEPQSHRMPNVTHEDIPKHDRQFSGIQSFEQNIKESSRFQTGYFNSQIDKSDHVDRRSQNQSSMINNHRDPCIRFPKPVFKYLKKQQYHLLENKSTEITSESADIMEPQKLSQETSIQLEQIKYQLKHQAQYAQEAKVVTKTNQHYKKQIEIYEQLGLVTADMLEQHSRYDAVSSSRHFMNSQIPTVMSIAQAHDETLAAMRLTTQNNGEMQNYNQNSQINRDEESEAGGKEQVQTQNHKIKDSDSQRRSDDEDEEEEEEEEDAEDDEDDYENDEDDDDEEDEEEDDDELDEEDGSSARESGRLIAGDTALGNLVQHKVQVDKETERLVTLRQKVMSEGNGKYTQIFEVTDHGTGLTKIEKNQNTKKAKESDIPTDYEVKMDKETWQYFKNQMNSIDQRHHKSVKMDQSSYTIFAFCKGFAELFKQLFDKEQTFMISQNDPRKTQWELFVIVLALYNAFSIPFELSFDPIIMQGVNFLILNTMIDIIFACDIFIQFRTTFYHPITGDEIKDLKIIKNNYMRGRFMIDFLSTVPFDNILYMFTQSENQILALFSLLKIFRVNRLGRIIARLNVSEDTKNSLKLFQLVFFIVMYIHCSGCAWFSIVNHDETWIAPLDIGSDDEYLYDDTILRKYFISIYHSVLLMTGNDAFPVGDLQVFFVVFSNTVGAIINANILGNMAVLIQDLNRKTDAFQKKLDKVNTAMQNIKLPATLQSKVVGFLQYTQQSQENQKELTLFIQNISPSLKHQVIEFIFQNVIEANDMFKNDKQLVNILFSKMELQMYDPEDHIIRQSERAEKLYFISKGECEVHVNDENRQETFVQVMGPGTYFGEIALISSNNRRTATVQTKSYSNIGHITHETFNEIITIFPDVKNAMKQNFIQYQDKYRCWQKMMLLNIDYFKDLCIETYEELIFVMKNEVFQQGQSIFIQNKYYNKVYVLISGEIEMFFSLKGKDPIKVDNCSTRGQVFNQISCLTMEKIIYSAKAESSVTMLTIGLSDLQEIMLRRKDLKKRIDYIVNQYQDPEFKPMLDYSRMEFHQMLEDYNKVIKPIQNQVNDRRVSKTAQIVNTRNNDGPSILGAKFYAAVTRCKAYQSYLMKKEGKFQELIRQLRRQNSGLIKKEAKKTEEVIESQTPTMKKKIQQLVIKQINQLHVSTEQQQERLKSIQELIKEIRAEKSKPASKAKDKKQKKKKNRK